MPADKEVPIKSTTAAWLRFNRGLGLGLVVGVVVTFCVLGRYSVTPTGPGQFETILLDRLSGETWTMDLGADAPRWQRVQ